ncbi:MAG TPA: endonuclease III [Anaerolineales bacterium]|nr:endonuclease III [Anaerolineales bacterium]
MDSAARRARTVNRRLMAHYGPAVWRHPLPPLDEVISTILSQNTNDVNRDRSFTSLRARFPTWEGVRDAPRRSVIAAIRNGGLAQQKAPRIQGFLRALTAEHGALDLEFLRGWPPEEARAWLRRFPGIGPKTAAIVMLFSLDMPAFPVDTHIYRVSGRLGLRPPTMTAERAHERLAKLFLPAMYKDAHLNLIRLGREICHPRRPDCPGCPLNDLCEYYARQKRPARRRRAHDGQR